MSIEKVIRAWKDADYRERLSKEECAVLPEHPSGLVELDDADLGMAAGGTIWTIGTITRLTITPSVPCHPV
jgi:mersacidin/lichenicidin family type 2 lantibiotic